MPTVTFKASDSVSISINGENPLEVFKGLANFQEVFGEKCCGKCQSTDISFRVRRPTKGSKTYDYPELVCQNPKCRAKLSFGQSDEGALFPVRFQREGGAYVKDENGKNVPRGTWGWVVFNRETGKEE